MRVGWEEALRRVPREVRLPGWLGPTFFTSELGDAELSPLRTFRAELQRHAHAHALVIGSVRETHDNDGRAYAAFCIDPPTGRVVLVDLDAPCRTRFVNTGLPQFLAAMTAFVTAWPHLAAASDAESSALERRLRDELAVIDAAAMDDADDFWPSVFETFLLTPPM